jgi:hypothetical protein
VTIFEYVLLVSLISLVAVGALLYLGQGSRSAAHVADSVAVVVSGGQGTSPGSAATDWCTSTSSGCHDTVDIGEPQVITFWASAGTSPYLYSLSHAPVFMTLDNLDPSAGKGQLDIKPTSCADTGTYHDVAIVVKDSGDPPQDGQLTFSLTVASSSC